MAPLASARPTTESGRPRKGLVGGLSVLGMSCALGIGGPAATATSSARTLRVVVPADTIVTVDPARNAEPVDGWGPLWYATCATLMAFRDAPAPAGSTVRPEAATGPPKVSSDGRTYVFTVRRGLRFSDGSRLMAGNFRDGLRRVLNPAMQSPGEPLFSDVKRVTASGRRLRIQLYERAADLPIRLALGYACPVPLGFPDDPAGVPLTVGSGPFYLSGYQPGRLLVLERNRYYRGARPHRVDRVVITIGGDAQSNISAVAERQADVFGGVVPIELRDVLAARYGVGRRQLFRIRGTYEYYLALNTSRPLFSGNIALRKAVNLALNRTKIAQAGPGWPRSHPPTDEIMPRWVRGWVSYRLYPLARADLRRAKRLAHGNLRGGQAVLYTSQLPRYLTDQASLIVRELGQIGLTVAVVPLAPPVLAARAGTRGSPYDLLLSRYSLHYPDPGDVIVRLLAGKNARKPTGNTNFAYFDVSRYNRRIAYADRLTGAARLHAFSQLDRKIMREVAPWAPLYEGSGWLFISKRVDCLKLHPVFRIDFAAMCVR